MVETLRLLSPEEFRRRRQQIPLGAYLIATVVFAIACIALRSLNDFNAWWATVALNTARGVSLLIALVATFVWGGRCGFVIHDPQGGFSLTNLLRNSVMTAIMFAAVMFVASPLIAVAFALFR
jgi:hypothetical protein